MIRPLTALLLLSFLTLPACDETDAVAVRIRLRDDLSGTVRTSGLVVPTEEHAVQRETQGVTWGNQVDIACASGTFSSIGSLRIADIEFAAGSGHESIGFARVVIPRGEAVRWAKTFVPLDATQRKEAAGALDPSGRSVEVGSTIKIEVELPAAVIGNGLTGKTRGVKVSAEGAIATLVVPLETIHLGTEPIVWHLTWQR
ncbi:MAG: hypothetical protein ACKVXR_14495 [Planctomycetota bacterium]